VKTIKLPLSFDPAKLRADLERIPQESWIAHFNQREYEGDWRVASLRSVRGQATQIFSDSTVSPADYAPTPLLAQCPYFEAVLAAFACPQTAVRLMALGAGSRIREHRDWTIDYENGEARLHVPIATSPSVEFYLAGRRIVMNEGEAWYLDFGEPHSVYNGGSTERIHMVLDCVVNDWLREALAAGTPR